MSLPAIAHKPTDPYRSGAGFLLSIADAIVALQGQEGNMAHLGHGPQGMCCQELSQLVEIILAPTLTAAAFGFAGGDIELTSQGSGRALVAVRVPTVGEVYEFAGAID